MSSRNVKTPAHALSRTTKPVTRVSAADGLQNVVAGLGTSRDKRSYTQFTTPRTLTHYELNAAYRSSWLAKRVINAVADDMTSKWREFNFDDETGEQGELLKQYEKRLKIQTKVNEAIRWSRLYGGCLIVLGIEGSEKGNTLATPLNVETIKQGDLQWLHVLESWRISPSGRLTTDFASPNFGLPDSYIVAESSVEVHYSRVLRFDGEKLPHFEWLSNGLWHDSVLQHVLDSVQDHDTTRAAIATMLFEANVDVIQGVGLGDLLSTEHGEKLLTKRFQTAALMKSFNRTLLLDKDETYEKKTNSFTGLPEVWRNFMLDVSGAAEIPVTRLFGQAATGFNATGEGDRKNYDAMICTSQETELRPQLEYLDELLVRSALGTMPDNFRFKFCPLQQVDIKQKADVQKTNAERDKVYVEMGVLREEQVAKQLRDDGVYNHITSEDIEMLEELAEAAENPEPTEPLLPVDPSLTPTEQSEELPAPSNAEETPLPPVNEKTETEGDDDAD